MTKTSKNRRFTSVSVIRILERLSAEDLQDVIEWIGAVGPGEPFLELLRRVNKLIGLWFRRDFRHAPGTVISQTNINDLLAVDSQMHGLLQQTSRIQQRLAALTSVEGVAGREDLGPRPFPPRKEDDASQEDVPLGVLMDPLAVRFRGLQTPSDLSRDRIDDQFGLDELDFSDEERQAIIDRLILDLEARNPQR